MSETRKKHTTAKTRKTNVAKKTVTPPKVTVILSVYNSAEYLNSCLDSIVNQSLKDIEIICIDDASEDESLAILKEYAKTDDRIVVKKQKHAGAAAARNKGLSLATGEYISVLDADDFFDSEMLEKAYERAVGTESDIVVFRSDFYDSFTGKYHENNWSIITKYLPGDVFCADDIPDHIFNIGAGWAWDKLFKRELVAGSGVGFQNIRTSNDMAFVLYLYTRAGKISFLDEILAHQRINNKSSLSSTREESWDNVFFALKELKERLEADGTYDKYRQSFVNWALNLLLWHIKTLEKEQSDMLKHKCREEYFAALDIYDNPEDYFYDQNEYSAMKEISEGDVLVSVIVPVYNGAENLRQCLDSICAQTLSKIEIICVDDGSTDESLSILREYDDRDYRISIIEKEHTNAGDARNAGLEVAVGEYLSFLDADDFFEPHMLETVYNKAVEEMSDVCIFRSNHFDHPNGVFRDTPWTLRDWEMPPHRPFSARDAKEKIFNMSSGTAWDKLFRREFIFENFIIFQSNSMSNDMAFTFTAMAHAEKISTVDEILAHQRVGHRKTLAKDVEYCTTCFAKALVALKVGLEERLIYDEFKKSYINWAIDFSLFNMHAFQGMFSGLVRQQLKLRYFEEMDIYGSPAEDFYNQDQYNEMMSIMDERKEINPDAIPKVSIIIPIYNVAHYLPLALDSAIYQTLEDIEIICVNDGSTDESLDIINEYADKDPRIVVITGENHGYGHAMNQGLDIARGEYIGIIEPDDFVDVNMYGELYELAISNELDYVKGDFYRFQHDELGNITLDYHETAKSKDNYNILINPQLNQDVFRYIMNTWSGIYKKALIEENNIRHNETPGASFQDNGFWFFTLVFSTRVYFTPKAYYYNRRDNPDSSVCAKDKVYCMNEEYALIKEKLDRYPEQKERFIYQFNKKKFNNFIFTYDRISDEYKSEYLKVMHDELVDVTERDELDWSALNQIEYFDFRLLLNNKEWFGARNKLREYQNQHSRDQESIRKLQFEKEVLKEKSEGKISFLVNKQTQKYREQIELLKKENQQLNEQLSDLMNIYFREVDKKPHKSNVISNDTVHIVYISDDNYSMPTAVSLASLKANKNAKTIYKIHIVASDVSVKNKNRWMSLVEDGFNIDIVDVKPDERFSSYTKGDKDLHVSPAAIIKLSLAEIFDSVGKVLYLDGDTIVQGDLLNLYNTQLDAFYVGAVKDIISERNPKHLEFLKYPHKFYFNSGMMLLNLTKMRKDRISDKLMDYRLNGINHFMDQDTLNVVLGSKVKWVSPRFNFLNKFYDWWPHSELSKFYNEKLPDNNIDAYKYAVILHLGSHEKPWIYDMGYLSEVYRKYYELSPYSNQELKLKKLV